MEFKRTQGMWVFLGVCIVPAVRSMLRVVGCQLTMPTRLECPSRTTTGSERGRVREWSGICHTWRGGMRELTVNITVTRAMHHRLHPTTFYVHVVHVLCSYLCSNMTRSAQLQTLSFHLIKLSHFNQLDCDSCWWDSLAMHHSKSDNHWHPCNSVHTCVQLQQTSSDWLLTAKIQEKRGVTYCTSLSYVNSL